MNSGLITKYENDIAKIIAEIKEKYSNEEAANILINLKQVAEKDFHEAAQGLLSLAKGGNSRKVAKSAKNNRRKKSNKNRH